MTAPREPSRTRPVRQDPIPVVTIGLIVIIAAVWLAMLWRAGSIAGTTDDQLLRAWGAAERPYLWETGQFWRLFTATFVHIGIFHLAINSYSLFVVGRTVEYLFDRWRALYIFLVAGVAGATASAVLGRPVVSSAGASGAIFGLLGAVCWFKLASPRGNWIDWKRLLLTLGINLAIGLSLSNYIDNWNHVGGLVGGFVAAFAVGLPEQTGPARFALPRPIQSLLAVGLVLAGAAVCTGRIDLPGSGRDYMLAERAHDQGRMEEAATRFEALARRYPDDPQLHYALTWTYLELHKCGQAAAEYTRTRELAPDFEDTEGLSKLVQACR